MTDKGATELRNASQGNKGANRNHDPLKFEEFVMEWRRGLSRPDPDWEGPRAVAELRAKGMYNFLLCEKRSDHDWQAGDLFTRIVYELNVYRNEAIGRLEKEYFNDVAEFLKSLKRTIQKKESLITLPRLKVLISGLREEVQGTLKVVGILMQEKRDWRVGVWQRLWPEPKVRRKNLVSRKIELDTRLQVELGKMFADYLRPEDERERVSLETIARLILLAYLVGDLAGEDPSGGVQTHGTRRQLSVRNIRDNLRYAGLHKAASFRQSRRERHKVGD